MHGEAALPHAGIEILAGMLAAQLNRWPEPVDRCACTTCLDKRHGGTGRVITRVEVGAGEAAAIFGQQPRAAAAAPLFPSIRRGCVRILTLSTGSETLAALQSQLEQLGLWARAVVQAGQPDEDGGRAGCWRAHVKAWRASLAAGCERVLILEDDAEFEEATLHHCNASFEAAVRRGLVNDFFLLGWAGLFQQSTALTRAHAALPCVYRIEQWASLHAYVVGAAAMRRHAHNLTWGASGNRKQLDLELSARHVLAYTTRPQCAFQRRRGKGSSISGRRFDLAMSIKADPALMHSFENDAYRSSRADDSQCAAREAAPRTDGARLRRDEKNRLVMTSTGSGDAAAIFGRRLGDS